MIYRVLCDGVDIMSYQYRDMALLEPALEMEINTSGSLEFTMPPSHVFYDSIHLLISSIDVYEGESLIWQGRPVEIETDYYKQKKIYCEGALSYFNDSVQELHEYQSISIREFFKRVVQAHNNQVAENRQFQIGSITIPDKKVYRKLHYEQTLDVLKRQCLNAEGGYFFIRRENGVNYIDWLNEMPYTCNQPIEFGLNLLDIGSHQGGSDFCTCVLPLGDEDDSGNPLTIAGVNHGSKILKSEAADTYGKITKAVTFDGVSNGATLLRDGREYLQNQQFDALSIECDAADLHYQNENYEQFRIGQMIHCVSVPHLVDRDLPLTKISLRLDTAVKQITLGTAVKQTLTEIYADTTDAAAQEDIDSLKGNVNDISDNMSDLSSDVSDLSGDVSSAQSDISDLKNRVEELEKNGSSGETGEGGDGWKHEVVPLSRLQTILDPRTVYFIYRDINQEEI